MTEEKQQGQEAAGLDEELEQVLRDSRRLVEQMQALLSRADELMTKQRKAIKAAGLPGYAEEPPKK